MFSRFNTIALVWPYVTDRGRHHRTKPNVANTAQLHWLPVTVRRSTSCKIDSHAAWYSIGPGKQKRHLADDIHLASESSASSLRSSARRKLFSHAEDLRERAELSEATESALSLVFTVILVTDVLLELDHVSGTIYLPSSSSSSS